MTLLGLLFGSPGATVAPLVTASVSTVQTVQPVTGSDGGLGTNLGSGTSAGGGASTRDSGTPVSAPATRTDFTPGAGGRDGWRLAEVISALGTMTVAERKIAAADRPGPVQPGSLAEAIKVLRGAAPTRN